MKVLSVVGPTASGKTGLAVYLAQLFQGTILSADSRQVYREMDLGTGKDLFEYTTDYGTTPHELIDIVDPKEIYSLYNYQRDCYDALRRCKDAQRQAILCGGTGLYVEAVLKQYHIPNVPEDVTLRKTLSVESKEALLEKLQKTDTSLYDSTDTSSKKRIIRALEIANFKKSHTLRYSDDNPVKITPCVIAPLWERHTIIDRIDTRLKERLSQGMIQEVEGLLQRGITKDRMDLLGLEYREISNYILKKCSYDEMVASLAQEIHRLAKRQMTWFRGMERRGTKVNWIKEGNRDEARMIAEQFLASPEES